MGASEAEKDAGEPEKPQHPVQITKDFYLGKYLVTQGQYKTVTGENPSKFQGNRLPVEFISWEDALSYCSKLQAKLKYKVMLPSEAQWEYACRAGTKTPFHFGSNLNGVSANCDGNFPYGTDIKGTYKEKTAEVGSYPANPWGLYDMHGNVWQWCEDWSSSYANATERSDPIQLIGQTNSFRILRGGAWNSSAQSCRSAERNWRAPDFRSDFIGFRVCLGLASVPAQTPESPKAIIDPDRRAAEYVRSVGGQIWIDENRHIPNAGDLPRESFHITATVLSRNAKVNDTGLAAFKGCEHIKRLELFETGPVSDIGLSYFKECKDMEELHIQNQSRIGDEGLSHLNGFTKLRMLRLQSTKVSDVGLGYLRDSKDLENIELGFTSVSDAGMTNFTGCKNLIDLNLGYTKVTDNGLASFKESKKLKIISLPGLPISDRDVAYLKGCSVSWLILDQCRNVTDDGLSMLDFTLAEVVSLNGTQASDALLSLFKDSVRLRELGLARTKVTAAGVDASKKAHPQCKIGWEAPK
jgi:hypothetical protein